MKPNNWNVLFGLNRPFLHYADEVDLPSITTHLPTAFSDMLTIELDGKKMRTKQTLFDAYDAAFNNDVYRLSNWDAFEDVMRTVDEVTLRRKGCVTFIRNAENCLSGEKSGLIVLGNVLESLGRDWSQTVEDGEWWDRGPKAFHTVFLFRRRPQRMPSATPIDLGVEGKTAFANGESEAD